MPNLDHQADAEQQDRKMEMSDWKKRSCTENKDHQSSMKKMQQALMRQDVHQSTPINQDSQPQLPYQCKDSWKKTTMIDIACIGTTSFQRHICNRDTEVFLTSLHEIDQAIEKKQNNEREQENAAEWEQVQQKLPA